MNKNEIRSQMVNELCETARSLGKNDQLVLLIGKIVDKYLAKLNIYEGNLTQDSYHNPMVKFMRSQAYSHGCYGCVYSVKEKRNWQCKVENELNIDLDYPNALRSDCKYSATKKWK